MKLSLHDLYMRHNLTPYIIDTEAGVPADTTYNMILWKPVKKTDAEKVLARLNAKYKQDYTLETVEVKLLEERGTDAIG